MKYRRLMHYSLALEVEQGPDEIYLDQGKQMIKMLKRFGLDELQTNDNSDDPKLEETHEF